MTFKEFWKKYVLRFPVFELAIFALVVAFDLLTKHFAAANNVDMNFLGKLVRLEYAENPVGAFSLFADKSWGPTFFLVVSSILIPLIFLFSFLMRKQGPLIRIAMGLIAAGALGNYIDRVALGYVRDFIAVSFFPPIFNIADSALTVGVVLFVIGFLFLYKEPEKKKKAKAGEAAAIAGDAGHADGPAESDPENRGESVTGTQQETADVAKAAPPAAVARKKAALRPKGEGAAGKPQDRG